MRIDTGGVAPGDRVDAWRERVSALLHPMSFEPLGRYSSFEAHFLGVRGLSAGAAIGVHGPSRTVVDSDHVDHSDPGRVALFVHRGQGGEHTARGGRRVVPPGSLLVECSDEPRTYLRPSTARMVILDVDASRLSLRRNQLRRLSCVALPLPAVLAKVLWSAPSTVIDPYTEDPGAIDSYLIGVADFVLRSVAGHDPDHQSTTSTRRQLAADVMTARSADSSLTIDCIADELGISRAAVVSALPRQLTDAGTDPLAVGQSPNHAVRSRHVPCHEQ